MRLTCALASHYWQGVRVGEDIVDGIVTGTLHMDVLYTGSLPGYSISTGVLDRPKDWPWPSNLTVEVKMKKDRSRSLPCMQPALHSPCVHSHMPMPCMQLPLATVTWRPSCCSPPASPVGRAPTLPYSLYVLVLAVRLCLFSNIRRVRGRGPSL